MITKCASNFKDAVVSTAQSVRKNVSEFHISTKALTQAAYLLNTAAGAVALNYQREATLAGAIVGSAMRWSAKDQGDSSLTSNQEIRANRIARLCLTSSATAYVAAGGYGAPLIAFGVGVESVADGLYLVMRNVVG